MEVPFALAQAPAYFKELMTGILKDFNFAIAYLDDIIFSRRAPRPYIKQVFEKLRRHTPVNETQQMSLFHKGNPILRTYTKHQRHYTTTIKTQAIKNMHPPKMPKQLHVFLGLIRYFRKFIRNFAKIAKPLTLSSCQQAKFKWTPTHHNAF